MSLRPRSVALSLIAMTAAGRGQEVGGERTDGSKEESSRMEMTKLTSGCARGTKVGAEDCVDKTDCTLKPRGKLAVPPNDHGTAPVPPIVDLGPAVDVPSPMELLLW